MLKLKATALALTLALAGCYTVEGVRSSTPARSGEFAADFRQLSACAARDLQSGLNAVLIVDEIAKNATVTGTGQVGFSRIPAFEITAREIAANRTAVDVRGIRSVWGTSPDAEVAWSAIERCAAMARAS